MRDGLLGYVTRACKQLLKLTCAPIFLLRLWDLFHLTECPMYFLCSRTIFRIVPPMFQSIWIYALRSYEMIKYRTSK